MKSDLAGYLVSLSIGVVIGLLLMVAFQGHGPPIEQPDPIRVPVRVYPTSLVCYVQPYDGKDDVPADAIPAKFMDLPSEDLGWRAYWTDWEPE